MKLQIPAQCGGCGFSLRGLLNRSCASSGLALAIFLAAGCGGAKTEKGAKPADQKPAGGAGEPAAGGGATASGEYPEWYTAAELPQYPGAVVAEAEDSRVTIDTTPETEVPEIARFYVDEMTKLGWSNDAKEIPSSSTMATIDFKKDKGWIKLVVARQMKGDVAQPTRATLISLPGF